MALMVFGAEVNAQSWQQVWSDEFTNGISGDWVFETGAGGWGNNELQYYRRENATVENGALVITAKNEGFGGANYTSARMKTQGRKSWKHGRIEARIAMPSFQGIWPAFWMLGDNISSVGWPSCGEIDIMEHVNTGGEVVGTIHWSDPNNNHAEYGGRTNTSITGYHTYAVEWNSTAIKWFVDGAQYHEVNIANGVNGTSEFQNNFFILLNMAVGGNWPGFSINNGAMPAKMYVDYVRVFQLGNTPPPVVSGVSTVYKHCDFGGTAVNLPVGDYVYGDLYARGVANEDISSIKVNSGYEMVIYEHDNFTGASYVTGTTSCLVGAGWNDRTTSLKVRAATSSWSKTIQAESYNAMAGVVIENGNSVGYIDNGDWMAYNNINFPYSGTYKVEYRVASMYGGNRISLDLNAGSIQLGAINVPSTGGWTNWTTISNTVNINAGTYNVGLFAAVGGFNVDWIKFTKVSNARVSKDADVADASAVTSNTDAASTFEVFPNPTESVLNVKTAFDRSGGSIKIFNVMGQEVMSVNGNVNTLDVSTLESGIYTIQATSTENEKTSKRFIKQ
jgi:beta-glucanase (GH16 family)